MIKVIFLDIDNTLLSFTAFVRQFMQENFADYGLGPCGEKQFRAFEQVNNDLWRQHERDEITFEEIKRTRWNKIFAALGISFDGPVFEELFREQLFSSAISEPGAKELLAYLAERYTLCAASNGPYEQQIHRLQISGMAAYFTDHFISSQVGAAKPSPAFFDVCFKALRESRLPDLRPEECMIIGDSMTSDMAGGLAYGIHTCLYLRGGEPRAEESRIEHQVRELAEIRSFL